MQKIFIIACEPSGDYLGGTLINAIKNLSIKTRINIPEFYGIGGIEMKNAGMREFFSIDKLSIIGICDAIKNVIFLKKLIKKTANEIIKFSPDVLITIDSSAFTHRINKLIKKRSSSIKIIHYVAPPVWAWRPWRAKKMHKFIDKLLTLLPFEPTLFTKYGLNTVFVGHPIAIDDRFANPNSNVLQTFKKMHSISKYTKTIVLLPGSRNSEIKNHLKIMIKSVENLSNDFKNIQVIIPTIPNLKKLVDQIASETSLSVTVISEFSQKILALYCADIAICASGTVTLELARTGVPSIVIYKTSAINAWIIDKLIKIQYVSLVNILCNDYIIPELLQKNCTPENISNTIDKMFKDSAIIEKQKISYKNLINILKSNQTSAAQEVLNIQHNFT